MVGSKLAGRAHGPHTINPVLLFNEPIELIRAPQSL